MTRKLVLFVVLLASIALVFGQDLHRYLSLGALKENLETLRAMFDAHPLLFVPAFIAMLATALALCIPGALVSFALLAGALFGTLWGSAIVLCGVVIGDSLGFLLARYLLRDWVRRRFATQFERIDRGFERSGPFYLLALRLMAIVPFFVVNLTMGLTRMRLPVFAVVSFVGLIPATLLHVNVGTELSRIDSLSDILSPSLIVTLALLGLAPLGFRLLLTRDQAPKASSPIATAPIGPAIAPSPGGPTNASISSPANEP